MSSTSLIDICNISLSHIGQGIEIASLQEESEAAAALNRYYEQTRNIVFGEFAWPFARTYSYLTLLEDNPNEEWRYAYLYPQECIKISRVLSGIRNDTEHTRIPYIVSSYLTNKTIMTDKEEASVEYTRLITDTSRYPAEFIMALSFMLAHMIAPRITRGNHRTLSSYALSSYNTMIIRAKTIAMVEERPDKRHESTFVQSRA